MNLEASYAVFDVLIVGGGPAGLSAALILGRCRRRVRVIDSGRPRNRRSEALHGFLTRDGTPPLELLRMGREELARYDVELTEGVVTRAHTIDGGFELELTNGTKLRARRLLLATGLVDHLPEIPGLDDLYGRSVHHCPYCDGWEHRDQRLLALTDKADFALALHTWSNKITCCTNGQPLADPENTENLRRNNIPLRTDRITRLEGRDGRLERAIFEDGTTLECDALFFHGGTRPGCDLAEQLGCKTSLVKGVETGALEETNIPGLYVAGDASKDVLLAIVAAAEGAKAAYDINRSLRLEDQNQLENKIST